MRNVAQQGVGAESDDYVSNKDVQCSIEYWSFHMFLLTGINPILLAAQNGLLLIV